MLSCLVLRTTGYGRWLHTCHSSAGEELGPHQILKLSLTSDEILHTHILGFVHASLALEEPGARLNQNLAKQSQSLSWIPHLRPRGAVDAQILEFRTPGGPGAIWHRLL